jgi:hypothetical protein
MVMATHEEPLPSWLEEELRQQGLGTKLRERESFLQKPDKRDPSEVSKPAYGRGEECPF